MLGMVTPWGGNLFFILRFQNINNASKHQPVTKCDHMEVLFMAKKAEKCDIVAGNSLATISVERMIRVVRDKQVLLDRAIAMLYGVETRAINQAVKRNIDRFPERYCFQLAKDELDNLKSQNVISSWGGDRF